MNNSENSSIISTLESDTTNTKLSLRYKKNDLGSISSAMKVFLRIKPSASNSEENLNTFRKTSRNNSILMLTSNLNSKEVNSDPEYRNRITPNVKSVILLKDGDVASALPVYTFEHIFHTDTPVHMKSLNKKGSGQNQFYDPKILSKEGINIHGCEFTNVAFSSRISTEQNTENNSNDLYYIPSNDTQNNVFQIVGLEMLENILQGYNGCIFAYGQSGSGKTYTMYGQLNTKCEKSRLSNHTNDIALHPISGNATYTPSLTSLTGNLSKCPEHAILKQYGLIELFFINLFNQIKMNKRQNPLFHIKLSVSLLEIYNDNIKDLINPNRIDQKLIVRTDPLTGPFVENLTYINVTDLNSILNIVKKGMLYRTTAKTCNNTQSSRSHAIFTVNIVGPTLPKCLEPHVFDSEYTDKSNQTRESFAQSDLKYKESTNESSTLHLSFSTSKFKLCSSNESILRKLDFVDLAGSERLPSSEITETHLKETAKINLSLTTLGRVIECLANQSIANTKCGSKTHRTFKRNLDIGGILPPYRDSVLTYLLMNSLGGNSKATMICTVNPTKQNYEETLNTLRYGMRARKIINKKSKVKVNEVADEERLKRICIDRQDEIDLLHMQIEDLKNKLRTNSVSHIPSKVYSKCSTHSIFMPEENGMDYYFNRSMDKFEDLDMVIDTYSNDRNSNALTQSYQHLNMELKKEKDFSKNLINDIRHMHELLKKHNLNNECNTKVLDIDKYISTNEVEIRESKSLNETTSQYEFSIKENYTFEEVLRIIHVYQSKTDLKESVSFNQSNSLLDKLNASINAQTFFNINYEIDILIHKETVNRANMYKDYTEELYSCMLELFNATMSCFIKYKHEKDIINVENFQAFISTTLELTFNTLNFKTDCLDQNKNVIKFIKNNYDFQIARSTYILSETYERAMIDQMYKDQLYDICKKFEQKRQILISNSYNIELKQTNRDLNETRVKYLSLMEYNQYYLIKIENIKVVKEIEIKHQEGICAIYNEEATTRYKLLTCFYRDKQEIESAQGKKLHKIYTSVQHNYNTSILNIIETYRTLALDGHKVHHCMITNIAETNQSLQEEVHALRGELLTSQSRVEDLEEEISKVSLKKSMMHKDLRSGLAQTYFHSSGNFLKTATNLSGATDTDSLASSTPTNKMFNFTSRPLKTFTEGHIEPTLLEMQREREYDKAKIKKLEITIEQMKLQNIEKELINLPM